MSAMLSSQTKDPVTAAGVNRMREVRRTEEREQAARSRPAGLLLAHCSFGPFGGGGCREGQGGAICDVSVYFVFCSAFAARCCRGGPSLWETARLASHSEDAALTDTGIAWTLLLGHARASGPFECSLASRLSFWFTLT